MHYFKMFTLFLKDTCLWLTILNTPNLNEILTHARAHKPRLWSCCLRSRDAVGKLQHWTALTGTGAATSGSPLAAPDLSTQTLCRDTEADIDTLIPAALQRSRFPESRPIKSDTLFPARTELRVFTHSLTLLHSTHRKKADRWNMFRFLIKKDHEANTLSRHPWTLHYIQHTVSF